MRKTALISMSALLATSLIATAASSQTAANGGRKLQTSLTGAAEAPNAGDPNGSGTASVIVIPGQGRICYELTVSNIAPATAAHIHEAPVGVAGSIVVALAAPSDGDSSGCVSVTRKLALEILKDPADYYVNVHNPAFPTGAVRGQLAK